DFFFSSRRRHTRSKRDWSSVVCSSDLKHVRATQVSPIHRTPLPAVPRVVAQARQGHGNSPILSPDPDSKPAISRTRFPTLISRGIHGDRKRPDKPIMFPSRKNKPGILSRQRERLNKKFL